MTYSGHPWAAGSNPQPQAETLRNWLREMDNELVTLAAGGGSPWSNPLVAVTGTPSVGDVPTATGAAAATWQAPSGGSSAGAVKIADFLFTEPASPVTYAITAADHIAQTFTIAGDHVAKFPPGKQFNVVGSSDNDTEYNVLSSSLVGGATVMVMNTSQSSITGDTPDGDILGGLTAVLELDEAATVLDVQLLPVDAGWAQTEPTTLFVCPVIDGNVDALNYFYGGVDIHDFTDPYDPLSPAATNFASLTWLSGVSNFDPATPFQNPAGTIKPGGGVSNISSIAMSLAYLEDGGGTGQLKIRVIYIDAIDAVNAT